MNADKKIKLKEEFDLFGFSFRSSGITNFNVQIDGIITQNHNAGLMVFVLSYLPKMSWSDSQHRELIYQLIPD